MPNFPMLSARAIAAEVKARRLTSSQAIKLGNEAIAKSEDKLQIFSNRAKKLQSGTGSLAGITVGVKDIFDTADMPTTHGSKIYHRHKPTADAALVTMLKNAGATIAGKTVTTEFAWFSPGPTRNPHNRAHTPGGSSSGSAAGVAAGYFSAAIGSQTGGSIIRPAAFCGIAGYKPSFRLFPTVGMKTFSWSLDTAGFFAANIADVAYVAAACSDRDLEVNETSQTPPVIGIYKSAIDGIMDQSMTDALKKIARLAKASGASVQSIRELSLLAQAREAHAPIQDFEACMALGDEYARHRSKLSKPLRDHLKQSKSITPKQYDDARRTANRARKACHSAFAKCDVLLIPSAPGIAPRGLKSTGNSVFNRLWTLMGVPCVNVPGLTDKNGMPLGLQIIAPFGQDQKALQAAHWLEQLIQHEMA